MTDTASTVSRRNSSASCGSWFSFKLRKSLGDLTLSRRGFSVMLGAPPVRSAVTVDTNGGRIQLRRETVRSAKRPAAKVYGAGQSVSIS